MTRINLIAFAGAMLVSVSGYGQTTTTRNINLPGFGLAATETARVSLTNLAANATNGTAAAKAKKKPLDLRPSKWIVCMYSLCS